MDRRKRSRSPRRKRSRSPGSREPSSQPLLVAPPERPSRQEPLEALLARRAGQPALPVKPVFMSKAARAAADAAEAAAAAEARRVESVAAAMPPSRVGSDGRDSRGRAGGGAGTGSEAARRDSARREAQASAAAAAELEAIRAQYSGGATAKRKVPAKPADKFKFLFDWAPEQDTSRPAAAGVPSAPEVLQFGRGLRAGMDRLQQRTAAADHTASLIAARAVTGAQSPGEAAAAALAARAASAAGLASEARYERIAATVAKPTHWKAKSLSEMTDRDWRIFREDHAMSLKGGRLPLPFRSWDESGLPDLILKAVVAVGYTVPSPIQMAAIPIGLAGRDLIGIAETGSGKTCAFVLPMLAYIMRLPLMAGDEAREALGPYALILSPTRELAQQTEEETAKFAKFLNYRAVSIVGGQNIEEQGFALRNGCEVIIGTPGRVMDCLERRYTVLHQCNFVVLDEADRMIDYGFEPQVVKVLDTMPSSNLKPVGEEEAAVALQAAEAVGKVYRTTFMFSATMPSIVERLARTYMRHPAVVTIGSAGKAASLIKQNVLMMRADDKPAALEREMARAGDTQVIVFVNNHKVCDYIGKVMERLGKTTCVLHGGKTQDAREYAIEGYRAKRYQVLIATDVAGRGIDVPDVGLVINYQMPASIEPYTHRIGRTGRAGKKGVATSFVTNEDADLFFDLKQLLQDSGNEVPPELAAHPASRKRPAKGPDFGRDIDK